MCVCFYAAMFRLILNSDDADHLYQGDECTSNNITAAMFGWSERQGYYTREQLRTQTLATKDLRQMKIQKQVIIRMIRKIMVGDLQTVYDSGTNTFVLCRGPRDSIEGVALLETGNLWDVNKPDTGLHPIVVAHAYGLEPGINGGVNMYVIEALAERICAHARNIADVLGMYLGTFQSPNAFEPGVYLSHRCRASVEADPINRDLDTLYKHMDTIRRANTKHGMRFIEYIDTLKQHCEAMRTQYPNHAYLLAIIDNPAFDFLRQKFMGGDQATYAQQKRTVATARNVALAMHTSFYRQSDQLWPGKNNENIDIVVEDCHESDDGSLRIAMSANGLDVIHCSFRTNADRRPSIKITNPLHYDGLLSEIAGALFTKISEGNWWRKQLQGKYQ